MPKSNPDATSSDDYEFADTPLFRAVAAEMESWLGDDASGHDMDHARRVFDLATRLAEIEGADREVVGAAALTHDVHRAMNGTEAVHPEESLPEVRTVLERAGFPEAKIPAVLHCVEVHDEYDYRGVERPAESVEAEILRDADNLDAIGAVGIARNFAFTGVYGNPLWDPDGDGPSGIGHCYDKLLELEDEMHTDAARELAADRHDFLTAFVERFEREWFGEELPRDE
ncbi:HD domain-containing protein [Halorussus amylolyticus]|uniref:HD domain-containing protein n=1 Tax=Halorussus amylolyticus TaxID=1126242 RepID=UPI00138F9700|nr:HD domain-containing protein [Halorussus amylolyticus]